jgi:hypothetical protein
MKDLKILQVGGIQSQNSKTTLEKENTQKNEEKAKSAREVEATRLACVSCCPGAWDKEFFSLLAATRLT